MILLKKNKVIYASSTMSYNDFNSFFAKSYVKSGQQAQKFNRLIIQGLYDNGLDVVCISSPPITPNNMNGKIYKFLKGNDKDIIYDYNITINFPVIKNVVNVALTFFKTLKYSAGKKNIIVCDVLNVSSALGATLAGKILRSPIVGIVTDVPELMVTGHSTTQVKMIYKIIKRCSHYVFLTEPMNARINIYNKPHVIIEAICDEKKDDKNIDVDMNNNVIYAGFLDEKYGIKKLVDAFILANIENHELHIYGSGPYAEKLKKITKKYKNIIFHGSVINSEVILEEKKAKLLVNPRPSNEEFTKYSFPSKNIEYMASGTPVLTTKLPGMPKEYYKYIYVIDDESVEGICKTLKTVLKKDIKELKNKGFIAQEFVTKNKNKKIQTKKIVDMIQK